MPNSALEREIPPAATISDSPDARYAEAIRLFGDALIRLACGYESNPERREDLVQEIHVALWRSFRLFDDRCSLRTWVYRVAHNIATKHIVTHRRVRLHELHTLDEILDPEDPNDEIRATTHSDVMAHLSELIEQLKPIDRQIILLYLEDLGAEAIGEVVGLSPENVATKVHRIKRLLAKMFEAPIHSERHRGK
jgi:RNA polymerase sigma-70 factor (ECF subfamily)